MELPRNIYCIGRNYSEHARELGNAVPTEPVVFTKPVSSVVRPGGEISLPRGSRVDHELEIVVALGADLAPAAVAVGIDATDRTRQEILKEKRLPWDLAKGRRGFAAVGPFVPLAQPGVFGELEFQLTLAGQVRQRGCTRDMLFSVDVILAFLGEHFALQSGDWVFTGTPPGVAPMVAGDEYALEILGIPESGWTIRVV